MAKSSSKTGDEKSSAGAKGGSKSAPPKTTKTAAAKAAKASGGKASAPRGGLAQPVQPSQELAKVVGSSPLPRSEIVKKIWDYIKANGLQDAKNKREINADATLEPIFGKKKVSMFEMNTHIARNVK
jgi:upstream activation factor subunit UAF30